MLVLERLKAGTRRMIVQVSRFGIASRGVVFGIIGMMFFAAAVHHDPGQARGLGGALEVLREQSYGAILLGVVAFGLIAYALYELVRAKYRRINA